MNKNLNQIETLITQTCEEFNCRLYLLEWNAQGLQIYIDKKDSSVSLLECEKISKRLRLFMDDFSDQIEVSSPGIERKLKYQWHFTEAVGKDVCVHTLKAVEGKKNFTGHLTKVSEEEIFLENPDCMFKIPFQDIEKANIIYQMKKQKKDLR